jgi:hypothetical protein
MPAEETQITDEEHAKCVRDTTRGIGTDNDPASFEGAFAAVVKATGVRTPKRSK